MKHTEFFKQINLQRWEPKGGFELKLCKCVNCEEEKKNEENSILKEA